MDKFVNINHLTNVKVGYVRREVLVMNHKRDKEKYAESIIKSTIMALKREMPELAVAFKILKLKPVEFPINISTDFKRLFYNPDRVIELKEKGYSYEIDFQVMHIILHGLLGDYEYVKNRRQPNELHLALDQRVDTMLEQLEFQSANPRLHSSLRKMREKKPYCSSFANPHTAPKNKGLKKRARGVWPRIMSDQHSLWMPIYRKILELDESDDDQGDTSKEWLEATQAITGESKSYDLVSRSNDINKKLKDSQKKNMWGKGHGNSKIEFTKAEGEALDYKKVLEEVLTYSEDPKENVDSIDPMYYYYSLENYDDVLLIEPRENEEVKKAGTICVALDTSGSCNGLVAQVFLKELSGLIDNLVSQGVRGKLLLIQCDDCIQKETEYDICELNKDEFCKMELNGYGGTDFTPVFKRIASYQEETEENIDVLIYLTDGCGIYPNNEPDYQTVFVLTDEDFGAADEYFVPSWIKTCRIRVEDVYGYSF